MGSKLIRLGKKQSTQDTANGMEGETRKPAYVLVDVECISAPCLIVEDVGGDEFDVLVLQSHEKWAKLFLQERQ